MNDDPAALGPLRWPAHALRLAGQVLLDSFDAGQLGRALHDFGDHASRADWDFVPKAGRLGVPLFAMTARQRQLAHQLLVATVSLPAYSRILSVMAQEHMLRESQRDRLGLIAGDVRNPENYFVSFFGRPQLEQSWSWRLVGHHVSVTATVVDDHVSVTPLFLGSEPATVEVFAPLAREEALGFALLDALDDDQRSHAVIHPVAPPDIVTRVIDRIGAVERPDDHELGFPNYRLRPSDIAPLAYTRAEPSGLAAADMTEAQRTALAELAALYLDRAPAELAELHRGRDLTGLHFAWAGHTRPGAPHYYRLHGQRLLVEFENVQADGNHIHTVWRDPDGDFGYDLLANHHRRAHLAQPPLHVTRTRSSSAPS